jgi:hypothetical protein
MVLNNRPHLAEKLAPKVARLVIVVIDKFGDVILALSRRVQPVLKEGKNSLKMKYVIPVPNGSGSTPLVEGVL